MTQAVLIGVAPTYKVYRRIVSTMPAESTPWVEVLDIQTGDEQALNHIEFHPANPDHCIISNWSNVGGQFYARSTDRGLTWSLPVTSITSSPDMLVVQIVPDPSNAIVWWALVGNFTVGADTEVYKSADGGLTWTLKNSSSTTYNGRSITVSPDGMTIVYMSRGSGASVYQFWQSTDGGETWANVFNLNKTHHPTHYIKYARVGSRVLANIGQFSTRECWESPDGGANWSLLEATDRIGYGNAYYVLDNDAFVTMFSQLPADAGYASYSLGNGDTFQNLAAAYPGGDGLASTAYWHNPVATDDNGLLLIAMGLANNIYVSEDRGSSWITAVSGDAKLPGNIFPSSLGAVSLETVDDRITFLSLVREGGKALA